MVGARGFSDPDETMVFAGKGKWEIVNVGGLAVGKGVFEPGWKWSENVRPIAGGNSCQSAHAAYVVSGRMKIVMDDHTEAEVGPGDIMVASPGHDAWTVGDDPCVLIDFGASVSQHAKKV